MGSYANGEDYPGMLRMLHSIAAKCAISAAELEEL